MANAYVNSPSASITADLFRRFPNRILIETGTGEGGGVQAALDAGFGVVFSIEANRETWERASLRFQSNPAVTILLGDSARLLKSVLAAVNEPVTIFLDAHLSAQTPILDELRAILASPFAHSVLIDDMRNFHSEKYRVQKADLVETLRPLYEISFADNSAAPGDVLCAVRKP